MKTKITSLTLLGAVILTLTLLFSSCAAGGESHQAAADINAALASTSPLDPSSPVTFFPVQKAGYETLAYPAALAQGQLVLENGYLRFKATPLPVSAESSPGDLTIWPPYSSLDVKDNTIQILNKQGQIIARVGDTVKIGGGQVPPEIVYKYTGQWPPENCVGPYWLGAPGIYSLNHAPTAPVSGPNPIMDEAFKEKLKTEPMLLDATIYANAVGISVDEALTRLKLQDSFSRTELQSKLADNETETFGGLWLQHEPEFKIVIAFTRDGQETLNKYLTDEVKPFVPYFELRTVKYSQAELEQTQNSMISALRNLDIPFDSGINIIENCVEIRIAESIRSQTEATIQKANLILPENVKLIFVTALASPG